MITLGVLGMPAYLVTRDPIATFNFSLVFAVLLGAVAMYLLIAEWTATPAAGIVAGILYAFNGVRLWNVVHPYVDDTAWTVLALLLARRFFAHGRWRDAVGAAIVCSLQLAGSFYPFLAATVFALPMLGWLLIRYGIRNLRIGPTLVALGMIGLAAFLVFEPYLAWRSSADVLRREAQVFLAWSEYLPGERMFPGWVMIGLILLAFVSPRARVLGGIKGDPRWAIAIGCVLVALTATGGNWHAQFTGALSGTPPPVALPNPYQLLARVIPGLDSVRAPAALTAGVHLSLSILAGFGAAAVITMAPARLASAAAIGLILIAYVDTVRPRAIGLEPPVVYQPIRMKPREGAIEFFQKLAEKGNTGPLLEVGEDGAFVDAPQVLLSAYHHRRTSACRATFPPPIVSEIQKLRGALPHPDAIRALRAVGFTTILVHHPPEKQDRSYADKFERAARSRFVRRIHGDNFMTAYAIEPGDFR